MRGESERSFCWRNDATDYPARRYGFASHRFGPLTGLGARWREDVAVTILKKKAKTNDAMSHRIRSVIKSKFNIDGKEPGTRADDSSRMQRLTSVLPTQEQLHALAGRIEEAYALRRPRWWRGCSTARVWFAAADCLWDAHQSDPERVPLDPELYVSSQPISTPLADPWSELAQPEAGIRYRVKVREVIRLLTAELKREIRRAERSIREGEGIRSVLSPNNPRLSPIGGYAVARRARRSDLAEALQPAAISQQRSCPLYKTACLAFIPAEYALADTVEVDRPCGVAPRPVKKNLAAHAKYKVLEN
jgi:hypothetical protein